MSELDEEKLKDALIKKAVGYDAKEEVKEFVVDEEGREVLSKKKVTKKHYSPDLSALKLVLDRYYSDLTVEFENMTEAELLQEKARLLQLLEEEKKSANRKMQAPDQM